MTDTITNAAISGFFLLGAAMTVFFLVLMCMDEFGRGKK